MTKALLINPPYLDSFWSFKPSCEYQGALAMTPPLGLMTVAALLPKEWQLRLADLNTRALSELEWQWADLILLTGMLAQKDGLLALIREAKARGKTVVVGGPYATSVPERVLAAGADFLVRGEAENLVNELLAALQGGKPQKVLESSSKPEMTDSPLPRFDLIRSSDYVTMCIQTSRGCPFECEFCDVVSLYGRKPRYKQPDQVLAELASLQRLGWRGEVFVADDNFIGNKDHVTAILQKLIPWMKSRGEPFTFWTQASINLGQDPDLVDLLTAANFNSIIVGVETPDPKVLATTRKHQNIRNPLDQSLANIMNNGLGVMASFMIGFDGEEPGAVDRICAFVERNHIPLVTLNTLQVFPNTALWQRLKREGRLREENTTGDMEGGRLNYLPTRPEAEIQSEYVRGINYLCEPAGFLRRAYRHILAMRPTRKAQGLETAENRQAGVNNDLSRKRTEPWLLAATLNFFWRQGVRADSRVQFWRQLLGVFRRNPSRLRRYLLLCCMGENMFRRRDKLA
ncbi:MAG: B12-binding domain-containing radical SAM protein [Desulfobaccales bacterium]